MSLLQCDIHTFDFPNQQWDVLNPERDILRSVCQLIPSVLLESKVCYLTFMFSIFSTGD